MNGDAQGIRWLDRILVVCNRWLWLQRKPLVYGLLDSGGTIYRESEQEGFGSRTAVKVRSFEF
ncbi:MAG TPA: hypothetical protein VIT00_05835 [Terrimicrobiaceae bacterium]